MIGNHINHALGRDCCDYKMAATVKCEAKIAAILKLSEVEFDIYGDLFQRSKSRDITSYKYASHCVLGLQIPVKLEN